MVVLNNEAIKEIKYQIESEHCPEEAGNYIYDYIINKNPHDNLTFALKSIKEDLKEILSHYPEIGVFGQIHFNILSEVIKDLGWVIHEYYYDTLSMNGNIRIKVVVPYEDFGYYIYHSKVKPFTEIKKFKLNETKSSNS